MSKGTYYEVHIMGYILWVGRRGVTGVAMAVTAARSDSSSQFLSLV